MNYQNSNNTDTVLKFKAGDTYTLALIFHQFYLDLCFFSKRIIDKPRVAENIVENAIIELWSCHDQFDTLADIKSFLYNTTRNACFQLIQAEQKGKADKNLSAYMWEDTALFMEKELIRPEVLRDIRFNLIENLSPLCKQVIKQHYTTTPDNLKKPMNAL